MGSDNLSLETHLEKVQTKEKKSSNFNLKKANWTFFQCEMNEGLEKWEFSDSSIEHEYKRFSELILRAAKASVPKCSTNRTPKPWWNADCDQARSSYREKFNQWKLYPSDETATQRNRAKKKLDEVIRDGKSKAWKEYASTLDPRVPTTKVWSTLKGFDGRKKQPLPETAISEGSKVQKPTSRKRSLPQRPTLRSTRPGGETEAERGVPGSEEETGRRSRPGRRNRQPFHSGRTDSRGSQHEEERCRSGQDLARDDQESPKGRSAKAPEHQQQELVPRPHPGFLAQCRHRADPEEREASLADQELTSGLLACLHVEGDGEHGDEAPEEVVSGRGNNPAQAFWFPEGPDDTGSDSQHHPKGFLLTASRDVREP